MSTIPALADLAYRMPEAGRIRLGEKHGKAMRSLDKFRFTSPDRELIEQLAGFYGGTCVPWHDDRANPQDQFEVKTDTDRIPVVLPPDCISVWYELWSAAGAARRCDGITCTMPGPVTAPCLCVNKGALECRPHTRINVLLPSLPLRGTWRLETKGWNALRELPGMVQLAQTVAASTGLLKAEMSIQKRTRIVNGKTKHFVVPSITLALSPLEIAAGQATLGALSASSSDLAALPAGAMAGDDDDVVDADLIPDDPLYDEAADVATFFGLDPVQFWNGLLLRCKESRDRMALGLAKMKAGEIEPTGFDGNGVLQYASTANRTEKQ